MIKRDWVESMNVYTKGIDVKNTVPISNHNLRPHKSDRNPTTGLNIIPVNVDTEIIMPIKESLAPSEWAKMGRSGVLPIW